MAQQERQQQENENATLQKQHTEQTECLDEMIRYAPERDTEVESSEAELSCMKKMVAECEEEHEEAIDLEEITVKLETMSHQNVKQSVYLSDLKDALPRINSYTMTQQKETEQGPSHVASLEYEIIAFKRMNVELEGFKSENAKLKEWQEEQTKLLEDMTARALDSDSRINTLEAELSCMKEKIAVCELEHGGAGDVNEMKKELETLRQQNDEQSASLRELIESVQCITSYSETQPNAKEQALRKVERLKDKIAAREQLSEETQQRQMNEIQSISFATKEQQQHSTGNDKELMSYLLAQCVK